MRSHIVDVLNNFHLNINNINFQKLHEFVTVANFVLTWIQIS